MEIKEDNKEDKLKGWGSWAGMGIQQRKISPEETLKRKRMEIVLNLLTRFFNVCLMQEKIKKSRKDGNLDSVIINEKRNKNVKIFYNF